MTDEPNLATVRARRAQLAKWRDQIADEDHELEIAERALTRLAVSTTSAPVGGTVTLSGITISTAPTPVIWPPTESTPPEPTTQRELVLSTLRHRKEVWVPSSADLQNEIAALHKITIKPNSLLPLLTTLKNEGVIRRDAQNRIALAERVERADRRD
jgi:hypothetical protein